MKPGFILAGVALLSGCSTNPITGREQMLALPAVQTAHADMSFALASGVQRFAPSPACERDCDNAPERAAFAARVAAIGTRLEASARGVAPDLFERIDGFQIEVSEAPGAETGSSASGRIVLGSGLARLAPTDTVIAFLIAREMAHVIARHAEENSGASIAFSVLSLLLPGVNVIARLVATRLGASALAGSWAEQQQREADQIAMALLEHGGLSARVVAIELDIGIDRAHLPAGEWGAHYLESARRAEAIADSPPRYAVNSD